MRTLRAYLILFATVLCAQGWAQTVSAEAFFNQASREYVKQDKIQALRTLDKGLQQYPGDPKLLKLAEELVKEDQKNQAEQQQQEQQQKDEQGKDQQSKDQQGKDQKSGEQEKQEQAQQGEKKDPQQQKNGQQGAIDPQAAMRMLDAMERSEKDVQEKVRVRRRPAVRRTIEKDW
ncbi:MAG TPA: hypothetical protein PL070_08075 [Flavobacteriales bacterium]|nr:hypothetical protein [Flavobacteriales bacterium]